MDAGEVFGCALVEEGVRADPLLTLEITSLGLLKNALVSAQMSSERLC